MSTYINSAGPVFKGISAFLVSYKEASPHASSGKENQIKNVYETTTRPVPKVNTGEDSHVRIVHDKAGINFHKILTKPFLCN